VKQCWSIGGLGVLMLGLAIVLHQDGSEGTCPQCYSVAGAAPCPTQMQETSQGRAKPPAEPVIFEQSAARSYAILPGQSDSGGLCDTNAIASLADSKSPDSATEEPEQHIRQWAEEDPSAAAAWAMQQPDPVVRKDALNQVALAWAERDVTKAITWAVQLPLDETQVDILINLGYEAARNDPAQALALAGALSPSRNRDDLVVHAISQWANTDALAATEWACTIPELALRERVLASITTAVADQNPETAVTLITETLWPGESQNQAVIATVQRWSEQDSQGANTWVQQFPAGELKDTALLNLVAVSLD